MNKPVVLEVPPSIMYVTGAMPLVVTVILPFAAAGQEAGVEAADEVSGKPAPWMMSYTSKGPPVPGGE